MKLRSLTTAALIAALYVAITISFGFMGYGPVQFRISEALTILPVFTPLAIPALFIGCILSNSITASILDIIFGSLATLLAAFLTRKLKDNIWLAALPPVVINALVVGYYLSFASGNVWSIVFTMCTVGLGQICAVYLLGVPLYFLLKPYASKLFNKD